MSRILLLNEGMAEDSFAILKKFLSRRLTVYGLTMADPEDPTAIITTNRFHNVSLPHSGNAAYAVAVKIDPALEEGRYQIYPGANRADLIAADTAAVFAALGRFLSESAFDGTGYFSPTAEVIDFTPARQIRGMYFATHFANYYQNAPMERLQETIEDLAAEGCNSLLVWYDMHHFKNITDPASEALIARLRAIIVYANRIGMGGSLTMLANESFADSPVRLRARCEVENGYFARPVDHYGVEICPSTEEGRQEILRQRRLVLERFTDLKIDYVCYWPYDQGGCTCEKCAPWGAGGFLDLLPYFRALVTELMPHTKIILSTWYFDRFTTGEWEGLYKRLCDGSLPGIEYVMSFFFEGELSPVLKEKGIPAGIQFIDFPEISMYSCRPWGGFGANPLPRFWEMTNRRSGHLYSGAFPYSEGIFEDINKYMVLHTTSGRFLHTRDAVRSYLKTYFCVEDEALVQAVMDTEVGLIRSARHDGSRQIYEICDRSLVLRTCRTFEDYDARLPENIRSTVRWRLLYIRAKLDAELITHNNKLLDSPLAQKLLAELMDIYSAGPDSGAWVKPPLGI